jgi:hypothetical protein
MAEVGAAAKPGIGQYAGKTQTRLPHPVDFGQRNLRLALRRARRRRHAGRVASAVQAVGRNSRSPTGTGTSPRAKVSVTSTCAFATLPSSPQYCRATPTERSPFLGLPESSTTSTAPSPPTWRSTCSASTRHSGASSQAGLLMKWCNGS